MMIKSPPSAPVIKRTERRFPVLDAETIIKKISTECAPSDITVYGKGRHNVFILPEAYSELESMICFGKKRAVNCYEQQYQGLGLIFIAPDGTVNALISHFLYIYSASRGPTHAKVTDGMDDTMLNRLAYEREIYNKLEGEFNKYDGKYVINPFLDHGKSIVVLNGHTHPGLTCFFSPPDRMSSYASASFPAVTFVCDPIGKDMKAMVGIGEEDAKVTVFSYKSPCADSVQEASEQADGLVTKLKEICGELVKLPGVDGVLKVSRGFKDKLSFKLSFTCTEKCKLE